MDYPVRLTKGNKDSTSGTSDVGVLEHLKLGGLAGTGDRYIGVDNLGNVKKMATPSATSDGTTFGTAVTDFNSPAPTDGNTLYRNTDTTELWQWDGVKWSVVGSPLAFAPQTTTATANASGASYVGNSIVATRTGTILVYVGAAVSGGNIPNTQSGLLGTIIHKNGIAQSVGIYATYIAGIPNMRFSDTYPVAVVAGDIITQSAHNQRTTGTASIPNIEFTLAGNYIA